MGFGLVVCFSAAKWSPVITRPELPPVDTSAKPASFADATSRTSEDSPGPAPTVPISPLKAVVHTAAATSTCPSIHHKEAKKVLAPKTHSNDQVANATGCEKSGVPAIDCDLSDANEEDDMWTGRDDDDVWDFIKADGEEHIGVHVARAYLCAAASIDMSCSM